MSYDRFIGVEPLVKLEPDWLDYVMRHAGAKQWWICEFQGASTPWRCKSYGHPDCRYRWVL